MNIEEASEKINSHDFVEALEAAIKCTNADDNYSKGFRNGLRYAIRVFTDSDPDYE